MNKEEFVAARELSMQQTLEFKQRMSKSYPVGSERVAEYMWRVAYEEGHAHGYSLVEYYYSLLYDLVEVVRQEQTQD